MLRLDPDFQSRQLIRIPPIGFHPIRSFFGNERRADDIAANAFTAQVPANDKTARTGLVNHAQLDVGLGDALDEFINGVERAADDAVASHLRGVLRRDGDGD